MFAKLRAIVRGGREDTLRGRLIRGASGSMGVKVVATAVQLLLAVVLARVLGVEGFGVYAFCLSLVQFLAIPAMLGLRQLSLREVAASLTTGRWGRLRGILRAGTLAVAGASLLLAAIAGLGGYLLRDAAGIPDLTAFWIALAILPLLPLTQVCSASLRALGHIVLGQYNTFLRPGSSPLPSAQALPGQHGRWRSCALRSS